MQKIAEIKIIPYFLPVVYIYNQIYDKKFSPVKIRKKQAI